jgi:polysaccharide biosynthesis protein VpsM
VKTSKRIIGLAAAFVCSASVVGNVQAVSLDKEGIQKGGVTFLPGLAVNETYNDNIYGETTAKNSWITEVNPIIGAKIEIGKHDLSVGYEGKFGVYHDAADDNYDDHEFTANVDFDFNESFGLSVDAGSKLGHDDRGSSDAAATPVPSEYTKNSVGTDIRIGRKDSNRIEIGAGYMDLDYTNNVSSTAGLEHANTSADASFFWELMPKTSLLVGIDYTDHDYDVNTSVTDSHDLFYFAGLDWSATGKTDGTIKLGYTEKDFDSSSVADWNDFSWDATINWKPLDHAKFTLNTGRSPTESTGTGSHSIKDDVSLEWSHEWLEDKFSTSVKGTLSQSEYQGAGQTRVDDDSKINLGADYKFNRWGMVGLEYTHEERDSNSNTSDYDRNIFMISVKTAM